ncbi:PIN domain-containing protein [Streptomyces parvus]|uniref:PIN domain-containing protein n=1 Tax=Streptomyces parvus TaxID=66428 RepID=UPI003439AA5B
MIILDTCVIRSMPLDGSDAHLLRAVRETATERVGIPWMVMEERAAQLAIKYRETYDKAAQALEQLRAVSPTRPPLLSGPDEEGVRDRCRAELEEFAEILPTNEAALRQGLYREANSLPPAGVKKAEKVGARDVVIWLSAVEYARSSPEETVYFVSGNTKDFTTGKGPYPSPMDKDVQGLGDRFVHLPQLAGLLELVAPSVEVDPERVEKLLPSCIEHFQHVALTEWGDPLRAAWSPFPVLSLRTGAVESATGWLESVKTLQLEPLQVSDVEGYQLGDQEWCIATVKWQVAGWARTADTLGTCCCTWETRIMMPLVENGPSPRILRSERPQAPTDAPVAEWAVPTLDTLAVRSEWLGLVDAITSGSRLERALALWNLSWSSHPLIRDLGSLYEARDLKYRQIAERRLPTHIDADEQDSEDDLLEEPE